MKYSKAKIEECAEGVQKFARKASKITAELSVIAADVNTIEGQIAEIGEPDYRDEEALTRLASLRLKLEACQKALARTQEKADDVLGSFSAILYPASLMVGDILAEIRERRLETIACSILSFCLGKERAIALAQSTDAYQSAGRNIQYYTGIVSRITLSNSGGEGIAKAANEILAVLNEALKDAPDFMKFLPWQPEPAPSANPSE